MTQTGLVPVFNHADISVAKKVVDACYEAGVRVFEFTNRDAMAKSVFEQLAVHVEQYQDLVLGIGTIFNAATAESFLDAGASFLVSPALVPEVAEIGRDRNVLWVPGCGTVTEMHQALQLGAQIIKIFPGNVLGPGFVKSARAVFPTIPIMPTGGVAPTKDNLEAWFSAGVSCVGMGSKLISKECIAQKEYLRLQKLVSETLQNIQTIRNQ